MPAPDSVTFNNETTEQLKILHKLESFSVRNETQNSKEVSAGVKSSCLAVTTSGKTFCMNIRERNREIVITSDEGHCDFRDGGKLYLKATLMGEEEADNVPSRSYTLEFVLQLSKSTKNVSQFSHSMCQKIMVFVEFVGLLSVASTRLLSFHDCELLQQ
jgi:hypothetical protein